jgi:hypothetical protein
MNINEVRVEKRSLKDQIILWKDLLESLEYLTNKHETFWSNDNSRANESMRSFQLKADEMLDELAEMFVEFKTSVCSYKLKVNEIEL